MSDKSGQVPPPPPPQLRAPASDYITPHERGLLHAISTTTGSVTKGLGELQKGVLGSAVSAFRVPPQNGDEGYCTSSQQAVKDCLAMVYQRGEELARKEDNIGRGGGDDAAYNGAAPPPITPSHVLFRTAYHTCDEPLRAFVQCSEASTAEYVRELGKREEK